MTGKQIFTLPNYGAAVIALWGIWIGNPLVDSFPVSPTLYGPIYGLVPSEAFWGVLVLIFGALSLIYSFKGRQDRTALVNACVFTLFALMYFIGDIRSFGGPFYALTAFVHIVLFWTREWTTSS